MRLAIVLYALAAILIGIPVWGGMRRQRRRRRREQLHDAARIRLYQARPKR